MIVILLFIPFGVTRANLLYCQWEFLPKTEKAHQYIVHDLFEGNVIEAHEFHAQNYNQIFKVKIKNHKTGNERWAMFKPKIKGDGFGYHRVQMEYVAYKMNRWLGMDLVPPVAFRRNITINGKLYPEGGPLIYFVDDAHSLQNVERRIWDTSKKEYEKIDQDLFYSDTQVMDVLLQNHDRHKDNFLRGKHWTDGEYKPLLIDHGAVLKDRSNAIILEVNEEPLQVVRSRTYKGLKSLDQEKMQKEFGEFLKTEEIAYILSKRDEIIKHFDELVESKGLKKTLIDR